MIMVEQPNMHLEKNLSLAILVDDQSCLAAESKLFSPNRVYLIRVKSKFVQTMGYSVEVSVDKATSTARVLKHAEPESSGLFEFLTSLERMKRAILDETSDRGASKRPSMDSSEEEDEKQRLKFVQTFDMLYPEEALYQAENGNLVIYQVDLERQIHLPMSVQQCYETFFHAVKPLTISMDDYIVYSNLVRLGYIVRRHHKSEEADEPSGQSSARADLPDFEKSPLLSRDQLGRLKLSTIMAALDFIPSLTVAELKQKLAPASEFQLLYDVHMPSKTFKKSKPGEPAYHLLTRRGQDRTKIPDLSELVSNHELKTKAQYLYSFVNENGELSFYHFDFKTLPPINELD